MSNCLSQCTLLVTAFATMATLVEAQTPGRTVDQAAQAAAQAAGQGRPKTRSVGTGEGPPGTSYVKVCNSGQVAGAGNCPASPILGYATNEWGCTWDSKTKLLWEVDLPDNSQLPISTIQFRDPRLLFTNYDSTTLLQEFTPAPSSNYVLPTHRDIYSFGNSIGRIGQLNILRYCNTINWRRPTAGELYNLKLTVNPSNYIFLPNIDTSYFPNTHYQTKTMGDTPPYITSSNSDPYGNGNSSYTTDDDSAFAVWFIPSDLIGPEFHRYERGFLRAVAYVSNLRR
jgi:hypothetical protein